MIAPPSPTAIQISICCGMIGILFTDSTNGITKCNPSQSLELTAPNLYTTPLSVDLTVVNGRNATSTTTATNSPINHLSQV